MAVATAAVTVEERVAVATVEAAMAAVMAAAVAAATVVAVKVVVVRAQDIECYHQGTIRGRCTQRMCIRCWCLRSCLRDTVCRRTVNSCNSCTRHSLSHCIRPLGTCCQCRGSNHCKKSRRSDPGIVCPLGTTCNCSCRSRSYTCRGCNLCRLRLYSRCMEQPDTDLLYNSCRSRTRSGLYRFGIFRRRTLHSDCSVWLV